MSDNNTFFQDILGEIIHLKNTDMVSNDVIKDVSNEDSSKESKNANKENNKKERKKDSGKRSKKNSKIDIKIDCKNDGNEKSKYENLNGSKDESIDDINNEIKLKNKFFGIEDINKPKGNIIDSLTTEKTSCGKKNYKEFYKGIYFDEDIYNALTSLVEIGGDRRNIQSKIVNDCLREVLENRGIIKRYN